MTFLPRPTTSNAWDAQHMEKRLPVKSHSRAWKLRASITIPASLRTANSKSFWMVAYEQRWHHGSAQLLRLLRRRAVTHSHQQPPRTYRAFLSYWHLWLIPAAAAG